MPKEITDPGTKAAMGVAEDNPGRVIDPREMQFQSHEDSEPHAFWGQMNYDPRRYSPDGTPLQQSVQPQPQEQNQQQNQQQVIDQQRQAEEYASLKRDAEIMRRIYQNNELSDMVIRGLRGELPQEAQPEEPQTFVPKDLPKMPKPPRRPSVFSYEEAQTNPSSLSGQYLREEDDYREKLLEWQQETARINAANNTGQMEYYQQEQAKLKEQLEMRDRQEAQRQQQAAQQAQMYKNLQAQYNMGPIEAQEFVQWASNPTAMNEKDIWIDAWRAKRMREGHYQPVQNQAAYPPGGQPQGQQAFAREQYNIPLQERYPRSAGAQSGGVQRNHTTASDPIWDMMDGIRRNHGTVLSIFAKPQGQA